MPVKTSAMIDAGPASPDSAAGRVKIPEPTMLPMTSAVAIHRPIDRFRRGFAFRPLEVIVGVPTAMSPPFSDSFGVGIDETELVLDRQRTRLDPRSRCVNLERPVLVEDLDPVGVGVVRKTERLLQALVQTERLAVVLDGLHLVAPDRQHRPEGFDRQLALGEVGDVELDHVFTELL